MPVEPIPCAPGGGGSTPVDLTACCAPSIASTALCRADGTTVLLVVRSGCAECGETAPDPEAVGWIDATTGTFTAGPAPADAGPCASGCIDTVCVTRCDDTDGDGAADVTYSELWCVRADGTTALVLTYAADPATPYTPVAPVDCEYACPQTETLPLCDGGGPFLRRITWLAGTAAYEDTELDGQTPHVVTGDVTVCAGDSPCAEQTTPAATLGLCLPDGTPLAVVMTRDCDGTVTQDGWLNLTTGAFTSGPPPAGAAACGDSRAFELAGLLCDVDPATGDVYGLVLVEYAYNADGSLASVRLVDPATGATYTLQGELRRCPGDAAEQPEQDLAILCDVQADGTSTAFVRDYQRDAMTGQITGHSDYTLDGTAYTPTGTVGVCAPEAEPCRNTSTVLLCDLPQGGEPDATTTDTDPAPYYPYTTGAPVPGGGQTLWDGGTLTIPAATAPQPGTFGTVATLAATLQAPRPGCDDGTAHVTVSVNVTQDGPDDGCAQTGHLRLFNGPAEADQIAVTAPPANTPAGWTGTLTVEAEVPAADLAAGTIAVALALDTYDGSSTCANVPRETSWTLSEFTADVVYAQTSCEAQFLRTLVTDCATGAVLSTTDTTLDGATYTVTGEVGQCTTVGSGDCCPEEPCRNTSSLLLCDLPEGGEPSPTVTDTDPSAYFGAPTVPVPGGGSALWSGGMLTIPADTAVQPGHNSTVRTVAARLQAPRPACDTGTAAIAITVNVEQLGPDDGCTDTGFLFLFNGTTPVGEARPPENTPVGWSGPLAIQADVPAEALAAGDLAVLLGFDTYEDQQSVCPGPRQTAWELSQFAATVAYDQAGCATQFLRNVTVDCETGAVTAVTDTTLDGQPYTVVGEPGQCTPAGGSPDVPTEPCRDTSTLLLCDDGGQPEQTSRISAIAYADGRGVLANGVEWTATPAERTLADNTQAWTFSEPARVRFALGSVNCVGECIILPEDAVPEQLYEYHHWDPDTRRLCALDGATSGAASVFQLKSETTGFQVTGEGAPNCLRTVGWIDVTVGVPPTQFLRKIVTDCDTGETISVTDTTLDGQPYTPTGGVGQCAPAGGAEPCPARNLIEACRCDDTDGDGVADVDYVELLAVDCQGALTSVGTYTPDLAAPYTPVSPVECDTAGAPPATAVQARRVQLSPGQSWDATAYPTLQSVTAVAHGGDGTITTTDGTTTLFATESATWSVAREDDSRLIGPLTIAASTGTVTVNYTIGA